MSLLDRFAKKKAEMPVEQEITSASLRSRTSTISLYDDDLKLIHREHGCSNVAVESFLLRWSDSYGLKHLADVPYFIVDEEI